MLGVFMKKELLAMMSHLVVGAVIGYASFRLGSPLYSAVAAFVVGFALKKSSPKLFNEKDGGWWFANGGIIYIFTWFIVWTLFYTGAFNL